MKKHAFFLGLFLISFVAAFSQQMQQLPIDPQIKYGQLSNGLTYYIRHNELPKERADFYIAQKVGSMQEEENQRGLAHFLEHMAFNGSKH
jgi:zinc protease